MNDLKAAMKQTTAISPNGIENNGVVEQMPQTDKTRPSNIISNVNIIILFVQLF